MRIGQVHARPVAPPARTAQRASASGANGPPGGPADVTQIAGIPEAELTPKVRAAIEMLMREVERLREELGEARKRNSYLEKLADEDSLLPVANRRSFVRELSRSMALSQRYGTESTLVYLDVDGMKHVNDRFGHAAGDAALEHVANVLLANTRQTDVVGRLGGDEFAVLLQRADGTKGLKKAEELAAKIGAQPVDWKGHQIFASASWGIYTLTGREEAGEAIDAADRAMYERKRVQGPTEDS